MNQFLSLQDCDGKNLVDIEENEALETSKPQPASTAIPSETAQQKSIDLKSADVFISDRKSQQLDQPKQKNEENLDNSNNSRAQCSSSSHEVDEYIEEDPVDPQEIELMKRRYLAPSSTVTPQPDNTNENQNTLNLNFTSNPNAKLKQIEICSVDSSNATTKCYSELINDALPITTSDDNGENLIVKKSASAIDMQPLEIAGILVKQ